MMRFAKPIFLAVLSIALAAYAFDCGAATTPEQAMKCCDSMSCSSHGHHAQDCCKTMPAMHAAFGSPTIHGYCITRAVCARRPSPVALLPTGTDLALVTLHPRACDPRRFRTGESY